MVNEPQFRVVLRGFDPAEVEQHLKQVDQELQTRVHELEQRTGELTRLRKAFSDLEHKVMERDVRISSLEAKLKRATEEGSGEVTFNALGERVAKILTLAEEEADGMRQVAEQESVRLRQEAQADATSMRQRATHFANELKRKAESESTHLVETAQQQAAAAVEAAQTQARAAKEESEALTEQTRAKAAESASAYEAEISDRQERAQREFEQQMVNHQQRLHDVQERITALTADADAAHERAVTESRDIVADARKQADSLLAAAREQAESMRRDTDREVKAARARRDAIQAQLSSVRNMLGSVGAAEMAEAILVEDDAQDQAQPADGQARQPAQGGKPAQS